VYANHHPLPSGRCPAIGRPSPTGKTTIMPATRLHHHHTSSHQSWLHPAHSGRQCPQAQEKHRLFGSIQEVEDRANPQHSSRQHARSFNWEHPNPSTTSHQALTTGQALTTTHSRPPSSAYSSGSTTIFFHTTTTNEHPCRQDRHQMEQGRQLPKLLL